MIPIGNEMLIRTPEDLGALVRRRRRALSMTQLMLAEQSGVGRRFLGELEDGKSTAQIGKTLRVLSMLGISLIGAEQ